MSFNAGSASIGVRPDFSEFQSDINAEMDAQGAQAAQSFADSFRTELSGSLTDLPKATVSADADTAPLDADLDEATRDRTAVIEADADTALADADLDEASHERTVPMDIDVGELEAKLAAVQAQLDELTAKNDKINIDSSALDDAKSKALALGIVLAAIGVAPGLLALGTVVAGVGAGFAAAALTSGGFTAVTEHLLGDLQTGAEQVSGFGAALHDTGTTGLKDFSDAASVAGDAAGHLFVDLAPEIQAADKFVTELAEDFDNWAKSVGGSDISNFFSKLFGGIDIGELKSDLGDIVTIIEHVAQAEEGMSPIAMNALSNVLGLLSHLPPAGIDALTALFIAMKTIGALTNMVQWASSVGDAIDKVKTKMSDLFGSDEDAEAEAAGAETGEAYTEGLETAASAGGGVGAEVAAELEEGAGVAGAAGAETGEAYAEGIEVGASAGAIAAETTAELEEGAAGAAAAGAETGAAYAEGMEAGAAGAAAVGEEAAAELETGTAEATGVGAEMGAEFTAGMGDSIEGVAEIVTEAVGVMSDIAMEGGMEGGEMLSAGFAVGILEGMGEVVAAATEVAEVAEVTMAAVLLIESPSKATMGLGEFTAEGFGVGMLNMKPFVEDAAGQLAHASLGALSGMAAAQSLGSLAAIGAGQSLPGVGTATPGVGAAELRLSWGGGGDDVTNAIVKGLRVSIGNATGGDVQAHLGHGTVRIPR